MVFVLCGFMWLVAAFFWAGASWNSRHDTEKRWWPIYGGLAAINAMIGVILLTGSIH